MTPDKIELSKSEAYKIVFDDLIKCDMFRGIYNARYGAAHYMYGVSAVMENIAINVSEDCHEKFVDEFMTNMVKSENEANIDKEFNIWIEDMVGKYGWDKDDVQAFIKQFLM